MRPFLLLLVFAAGVLNAGPIYSVTDLGGLGGSGAVGYKINSAGEVVGWAATAANYNHAFASGSNGLQDLTGATASEAYAYGVNSGGWMVGTSYVGGQPHGTIWSGAGIIDLGAGTFGTGINDSGQVA